MWYQKRIIIGFVLSFVVMTSISFDEVFAAEGIVDTHSMTIMGKAKYEESFPHFDYVNPNAPKGGFVVRGVRGSFDSLNPFIIRGTPATSIALALDTLMETSLEEPSTSYVLLAEKVRYKKDGTWVEFHLKKNATFQDGSPVLAKDVKWTFETLTTKGNPQYRYYYQDVERVEALSDRVVRFYSNNPKNGELFYILGQLPILSASWWQGKEFDEPSLDMMMGSGPYRIKSFEAGKYIEWELDPNYWGRQVNVKVGRHNFGRIRYDYFRDETVLLSAFLAGKIDIRSEFSAKNWHTAYEVPALAEGRLIKRETPHKLTAPAQGFVLNLRRKQFQDVRVREAMNLAFDFENTNKTVMYNAYKRTKSYFDNGSLASHGSLTGEELALLEPYRNALPSALFAEEFIQPTSDQAGGVRPNLRKASLLLKEAGFVLKDGVMTHEEKGYSLSVELLLVRPAFQAHALGYSKNLEKLGIRMKIRTLDITQYIERLRNFDFDMIIHAYGQSLSPGNEQRDFWSSVAADRKGSRNYAGIKNPVVDDLIEVLVKAPDRRSLEITTRALDRVLLWNHYLVLMFHSDKNRLSYWDRFDFPPPIPLMGDDLSAWWVDVEKDKNFVR